MLWHCTEAKAGHLHIAELSLQWLKLSFLCNCCNVYMLMDDCMLVYVQNNHFLVH